MVQQTDTECRLSLILITTDARRHCAMKCQVCGHLEYAACIHLSQHLSMRMPNYKTKQNSKAVSQFFCNCTGFQTVQLKSPGKMTQGKHYNLFESCKLKMKFSWILLLFREHVRGTRDTPQNQIWTWQKDNWRSTCVRQFNIGIYWKLHNKQWWAISRITAPPAAPHMTRHGCSYLQGCPNCPFSGHMPCASTKNSWWRAGRGAWHHPIWRPWRRGCTAGGTTRAAWARELFRQCRWHRHFCGTAVTLQVRDWGTYSNPNNQSKKHCDWHVAHWVQFGGSGREHWSQDGIALDAQFSMWAPTAKCRISVFRTWTNATNP